MTSNTAFPEPWPATVPTLAQIQTDLAAYQATVTATATGDRTQIAARKAARAKLAADLGSLAFYVQGIAMDNAAMLATTGFPPRQHTARVQNPEPPAAPGNFRLSRGTVSGSIVLRATRVPGAGSYDVQIATADPTVESNWTAAGSFKSCRRIDLPGLTTLKTYSVRMRALGAGGPGAWTPPTSISVV